MILIADSGSTKTTWSIVEGQSKIQTCNTSGINPFFLGEEEILEILKKEFTMTKNGISSVFFYGAGCIPAKTPVLFEALKKYFGISNVEVHTDLLAAARSLCQDKPGIACILGTGSNSCYYDGKVIAENVSPLGFILGDEGSGAVLGKKLLADLLKNQLPSAIKEDFFATYPVEPSEILENVYRKPFPNRYLAQYTRFINKHIHNDSVSRLVETSFGEFIERNLFQYDAVRSIPVHFTGSVAFYFRASLEKAMNAAGLKLGNIMQAPMDGLIDYHLNMTKY